VPWLALSQLQLSRWRGHSRPRSIPVSVRAGHRWTARHAIGHVRLRSRAFGLIRSPRPRHPSLSHEISARERRMGFQCRLQRAPLFFGSCAPKRYVPAVPADQRTIFGRCQYRNGVSMDIRGWINHGTLELPVIDRRARGATGIGKSASSAHHLERARLFASPPVGLRSRCAGPETSSGMPLLNHRQKSIFGLR